MIGHGRGKLILCGEHAVVYGHPAVAMAVDRGTTAVLVERSGPTRVEGGPIADPRLPQALRAVLPAEGLGVRFETDLPIGRGMGSSAALAVALVRAEAARTGEDLDPGALWDRAMGVERVFHGNPSGLDHAVSASGGIARFRRPAAGERPVLEPLPAPAWTLVVLDSGVAGDTGRMVAGVASRRPAIDGALARIGGLADQVVGILDDVAAVGELMNENHALLCQIGVSTPALDALVAVALRSGARGAKLAGAGGGGVVIAIAEDWESVIAGVLAAGVAAFPCRVSP